MPPFLFNALTGVFMPVFFAPRCFQVRNVKTTISGYDRLGSIEAELVMPQEMYEDVSPVLNPETVYRGSIFCIEDPEYFRLIEPSKIEFERDIMGRNFCIYVEGHIHPRLPHSIALDDYAGLISWIGSNTVAGEINDLIAIPPGSILRMEYGGVEMALCRNISDKFLAFSRRTGRFIGLAESAQHIRAHGLTRPFVYNEYDRRFFSYLISVGEDFSRFMENVDDWSARPAFPSESMLLPSWKFSLIHVSQFTHKKEPEKKPKRILDLSE